MRKKIHLIVFILLLLSISSQGQEILCKIVDLNSNESVIFATVRVKNKGNGVIADENGNFRLPLRYKQQNDTLLISSIGYKSKEVFVNSLNISDINIILLQPKTESLNEIVIVSKKKKNENTSGRKIVNKAIERISINFPTTPFSYIGYYRDYQLLDSNYINLNEGIVQMYDAGFKTNKIKNPLNRSALYQYTKNSNFRRDLTLEASYNNRSKYVKNATITGFGGNELSILNIHDPIRNYEQKSFSFIDVFSQDFLQNHEFRIEKTLFLDNIPLYIVNFSSKKEKGGWLNHYADGSIYISHNTFAIHKLEYKMSSGKYKKNTLFTVKVEYLPKGNLMFLNYISFNNQFVVKSKDDFKIQKISFDKLENALYLKFNNDIKTTSIENKKNYRFTYKNEKLKIDNIELIKPQVLKLTLVQNEILTDMNELDSVTSDFFMYSVKNIRDVSNRKLDKPSFVKANQLREFFVQEIFPNKPLPPDVYFVRKTMNLSESLVNKNEEMKKYWINSPLKPSQKE